MRRDAFIDVSIIVPRPSHHGDRGRGSRHGDRAAVDGAPRPRWCGLQRRHRSLHLGRAVDHRQRGVAERLHPIPDHRRRRGPCRRRRPERPVGSDGRSTGPHRGAPGDHSGPRRSRPRRPEPHTARRAGLDGDDRRVVPQRPVRRHRRVHPRRPGKSGGRHRPQQRCGAPQLPQPLHTDPERRHPAGLLPVPRVVVRHESDVRRPARAPVECAVRERVGTRRSPLRVLRARCRVRGLVR